MLRWWHLRPLEYEHSDDLEKTFMAEAFKEYVHRQPKPKGKRGR